MSDCELSPSAYAFSTVLTAFIGSIINGFCNGALIAFITGWIAWLSVVRVLVAAMFEYRQTIQAGTDLSKYEYSSTDDDKLLPNYELLPPNTDIPAVSDDKPSVGSRKSHPRTAAQRWMNRNLDRDVKLTGWLSWTWSAVYIPISSTIWTVENVSNPVVGGLGGGIKLARAVAIGVSALSLTFDNKQRYAANLGRRWGAWAFVVFNLWTATACLILGVECAVLLITGALQVQVPWFVYIVIAIFSCIWAAVSFAILPIVDGSRRGVNVFIDVLVGVFAGVFVAAPAFVLWQNANFNANVAQMMGTSAPGGLSLGEYLSCEGASALAKFAAIMP